MQEKEYKENNRDAESNANDSDRYDGNDVQGDDKNSNEQAKIHVQCGLLVPTDHVYTQLNVGKVINISVTCTLFFGCND